MPGIGWNGWKWLKMAKNGRELLKWLEMAKKKAGNGWICWKWLKMAGHGRFNCLFYLLYGTL